MPSTLTLDEPVQVGINFALQPPSQPPALCNAAGFCWKNPRPQGNRLNYVAVLPSGEVWAVGEAGTVVRRIGTTNTLPDSGTLQHLQGAAVVGTEVVMVGTGGVVMRGTGGIVTAETSGALQDLSDVTAVGTGAAVVVPVEHLRRNGIAWSSDTSGTTLEPSRRREPTARISTRWAMAAQCFSQWGCLLERPSDPQFGTKPAIRN